jgi:hypothetical protein
MFEPNEVVNLIASTAFFSYYFKLTHKGKCNQMPFQWTIGILCLTLSNVFTVVEGFIFPVLFNTSEHVVFFIGTLFFLVGAFRLKVIE